MNTNPAGELSELLMCSTALGAGVITPFSTLYDKQGLIFASAVSEEFKTRVRAAASLFDAIESESDRALRRRVHDLEQHLAVGDREVLTELENLRPQLEEYSSPYVIDLDAANGIILETVKKSRYKHLTLLDSRGFRMGVALGKTSSTAVREGALLDLTAANSVAHSIVRRYGSGEMQHTQLVVSSVPAFTYFSAPPVDLAEKLVRKVTGHVNFSPLQGFMVVIPFKPARKTSIKASTDDVLRLLKTYYVLGSKKVEDRAHCVVRDPDLERQWRAFLESPDVLQTASIPENRMARAERLLANWYLRPDVAAVFATRAAVCAAVLDHTGDNPLEIELRREHFELALKFFRVLFNNLLERTETADKLAENAARAREARNTIPSPAAQEMAVNKLKDAIINSEHGVISRRTAVRLPGVTPSLLDYIIENHTCFVEVCGNQVIGKMRATRTYALRSTFRKDAEEAIDELNEAIETFNRDPHDPMFGKAETVRHTFMSLAKQMDAGTYGLPAIPIDVMTAEEIRCIPAILADHPEGFVLRNTPENPEPPKLVKSPADPDAAIDPGIPVLWVRWGPGGKDLRDWKFAKGLGFADTWGRSQT